MEVTDEMVYAFALEYYGNRPASRDPQLIGSIRNALTAALATAPARYREGFEAAREMAAVIAELPIGLPIIADLDTGEAIAAAIRAEEMPE
jgi:hypothetical protein